MASQGDSVRWYADKKAWRLLRKNVMVEGDRDVRYFELADRLYWEKYRRRLIGEDLSILSAGTGDHGGTDGVFEEFPTLVKLIQTDCDNQGKTLFRVVALLDNDRAGRSLAEVLVQRYRGMRHCRDVFLLNRALPRTSSEPTVLFKQIKSANSAWKSIDCEIEDLVGAGLLDAFISEMPNALARQTTEAGGYRHYEWHDNAKSRLVLFTKEHAMIEDVGGIIETLKSIRFYLALDPDGAN